MFHGSIPAPLRSIIYEHAGTWPETDIYIGCSGNFTIERVLHSRFGNTRPVHGNDITAYSCALGWYLAGEELPYTLRPEFEDSLGWLAPYMEDRADRLATLMLGTRFLQYVGKEGAYYRRMLDATQDQWPRMHEKTATKLRALETRLGSFYAGDVRTYLRGEVPEQAPVVMFPPFYCLSPEHRLLTADLRWVPCGELGAGDRLLAFDEEVPDGRVHRRLRWSEVVRSEPAMKECVRVIRGRRHGHRLHRRPPLACRHPRSAEPDTAQVGQGRQTDGRGAVRHPRHRHMGTGSHIRGRVAGWDVRR
ncbi:hypothetical protein GCM10009647_089290 [Streptomyces sanglieri]|uniref:GNAT-like N-terminal domain-containing protein n=1 Tax=Streptomyces sanglieri TaxID=193460 RepID=A0ABW2X3W2_9ACTN|nr:hypothetical protein [Streptomyces sp. Wh19]MDV9198530.1 hypothetical protein [Streptomyces sp. Wh19]